MEQIRSKRETNKMQKREALIEASEKLFKESGFENTSIEDVAKRARLTKRTLYQYFKSKEDLFYAVALKAAKQLSEASVDAIERGENTREKIRLANLAHLDFYREHADLFQILNYIPANQQNSEASPHYQQIKLLDSARMQYIASLIVSGTSDGSINPKLDMKKVVLFGFFSAFSMLYTFACTDKSIWKALSIDENEFLDFSFGLFADAMK